MITLAIFLILANSCFSQQADYPDAISNGSQTAREDGESGKGDGFCFRARPSPRCGSFLVTEFSYLKRFSRSGYNIRNNNNDFYFLGEVGWMKNLDKKNAIGGTIYFGLDDNDSELAFKPRYRRWLSPKISLDLSMGPIIKNFGGYWHEGPGFIGQAQLGFNDVVMLITQLNIKQYRDYSYLNDVWSISGQGMKDTEKVWYGGIKIGSHPGLAILIIAPVTILVISIITLGHSD